MFYPMVIWPLLVPVVSGILWIVRIIPRLLAMTGFSFRSLFAYFGFIAANNLFSKGYFIVIFLGFFSSAYLIFSGLSYVAPDLLNEAYRLFVPSNFKLCLSAVLGVRVTSYMYHVAKLQLRDSTLTVRGRK